MEALLPELHNNLVRAATRRHVRRRRRTVALTLAALLLASTAALAGSGLLGDVDHGTAGSSHYSLTALARENQLCLQVTWRSRLPAIRCAQSPSAKQPFGPVLRAVTPNGRGQLLAGLVRGDVERVRIGGRPGSVETVRRAGIPGRTFVVKGRFSRVALEALAADGRVLGTLGTSSASKPPTSHAQATRQGDPAAFAPTQTTPPLRFRGHIISIAEATRRHLSCVQDTGRCVTRAEFRREIQRRCRPTLLPTKQKGQFVRRCTR